MAGTKAGKGAPHIEHPVPKIGVDGKKDNIKRNVGLEQVPGTSKGGAIYSPFKDRVMGGFGRHR